MSSRSDRRTVLTQRVTVDDGGLGPAPVTSTVVDVLQHRVAGPTSVEAA